MCVAPMQNNDCGKSLANALRVAQDAIRAQPKQLGSSEADTKSILIEPVLNALGWNTMDTRSVKREYRPFPQRSELHKRQLDYALFASGAPCILVEAKRLNDVKKAKNDIADIYCKGTTYIGIATDGYAWSIWKDSSWIDTQIDASDACNKLSVISRDNIAERTYEHESVRALTEKFRSREPHDGYEKNAEDTNEAVRLFTKFVVKNKDTFKSNEGNFYQMERAYLNILLRAGKKTMIREVLYTFDGLDADEIIKLSSHGKYLSIARTLRKRDRKYRYGFLELVEAFQTNRQYNTLLEKLKMFVNEVKVANIAALTGILSSLRPEYFMVYNKRSSFPLKSTIYKDLAKMDMKKYQEFNEVYQQISKYTNKSLTVLDGIAIHMRAS